MKKGILILLMFAYVNSMAQNISYAEAERTSYNLFLQGKWDELIKYGNNVIREGLDFYYLRVRLGEAYMAKGKYRMAIKHLRKALDMNSFEDVFVIGLLYRSYLATGQYVKANSLKKYIALDDNTSIDAISFQIGVADAGDKLPELDNEPERTLNKTSFYGGRLYMYKGDRLWTITANLSVSGERFYYRNEDGLIESESYNSKMTNISFDKTIDAGKNFLFYFGFNPVFVSSYNMVETSTLVFRPSFMPREDSGYTLIKVREFVGNFAAGFTYSGTLCDMGITASLSYSDGITYSGFGAINGFLTFYPLANNKLYIGIKSGLVFSAKSGTGKTVYSVFAGFNTKFLGLEGYYYLSSDDMNYWYESPGFFYLSNFPIVSAGGLKLNMFLSKKVTLFGGYGFVNYETMAKGGNAGILISF